MNFAAPAILLVLLLLPGVIARSAYQRGNWDSHPFRTGAIGEEIAIGSISALTLHLIAIVSSRLIGFEVRVDLVLALLYGPSPSNPLFSAAIENVSTHLTPIATYNALICIAAWVLGYFLHCSVRLGKLDLQTRVLRFPHEWHYLFSGEILDFDRARGPFVAPQFGGTLLAVLVDQQAGSYIYRGLLRRYYFDKEGRLDQLVLELPERAELEQVQKRELAPSSAEDYTTLEPFEPIDGQFIVISFSDVRNMNVLYVQATELRG